MNANNAPQDPATPPPLPPHGEPEPPSSSIPVVPPPDRSNNGFFAWIHGLGVRRGQDRWLGGVASGLADRWNMDPVIVRGLFVVGSLFFGLGVLLYGLAWALLPEPDGRTHTEEMLHGRWSTGATGAAILTVLGLGGSTRGLFVRGWTDGGFPWPLLWLAAVGALIYWVLSTRSDRPRPAYPAAPVRPTAAPYTSPPRNTDLPGSTFDGPAWSSPPAMDWQPARSAPKARRRGPGAGAVAISTGVAMVAAAAVLLLANAQVLQLGAYGAATAWATAAIVLGLGVAVCGALGRGGGGQGLLAVIALLVAGGLSVTPVSDNWLMLRQDSWSPTTLSEAAGGINVFAADATVNLAGLDPDSPLQEPLDIPVTSAAATLTINLPADIPVTLTTSTAAADIRFNGTSVAGQRGVTGSLHHTFNPGAAGKPIVLTVSSAAGTVNINTITALSGSSK